MKLKNYVLILSLIATLPSATSAKLVELSGGNANLDMAYVSLDNKPAVDTVFSRFPGYNGRFNIFLEGKALNRTRDYNSIFDVTFSDNLQTKNYIHNVMVQLKKPDEEITIGDVYSNFSRLSLMNTRIRGLQIMKTYRYVYPEEVINERRNNQEDDFVSFYGSSAAQTESAGSYFLEDAYVRPFSTTRVWLFGGISRIKEDPGTGSQFGVFRQFAWGGRLETNPTVNSSVGAVMLQGKDDENSVDRAIASDDPFTNRLLSADMEVALFKGKSIFSSVYSYSDYDEDIFDALPTVNDYAYELRLKQKIKWLYLEGYFAQLGTDFFTIGNPYLSIDKKGYKIKARMNPSKILNFRGEFERYHDNVNKKATTTLEVNDLNTSTKIKYKKFPKLTLGFKINQKQDSAKTTDNKKTTYESQLADKYFGCDWKASYSYIKYRDDVLTTSTDTTGLSVGSRSANEYRAKGATLYLARPFLNNRLVISAFGSQSNYNFFNSQSKSEYLSGNGKIEGIIFPGKFTSTSSVDFSNSVTDNVSQVKTITGKQIFKYVLSPDRAIKLNYIGVKSNYLEQDTEGDANDYISHTVGIEYSLIF